MVGCACWALPLPANCEEIHSSEHTFAYVEALDRSWEGRLEGLSERDRIRGTRRRLLRWARSSGRDFWWRNQRDPFITAVVEILLKQTRASSVEERVRGFVEKYPTPETLAQASVKTLSRDLTPFGFHRQRALHLKALGEALAGGQRRITAKSDELLSLPGIGPYAASAIRCFVFGARDPVIDVNVVRIVERVFRVKYERGEGRRNKDIRRLAFALLDGRQPREMNWALLDLGALVCRENRPLCDQCPLSQHCLSRTEAIAA